MRQLLLCFAFLALSSFSAPASADSVTFGQSGGPIVGEDPSFLPNVSATFDFGSWYAAPFELVMTMFAGLTIFSVVTATRGRITEK